MILRHQTLATGDTATHRTDTFTPEAIAACKALLPTGGGVPEFPAFRVEITRNVFTIYRGREPLVTCGCSSEPDPTTWQELASLQAKFAPVEADSEPTPPWLTVCLLPPLAMLTESDVGWLGDFERCLAAAILENGGPE